MATVRPEVAKLVYAHHTRNGLTTAFAALSAAGTPIQEIRKGWQMWGRRHTPQRLLNVACMVITRSVYNLETPWQYIIDEVAPGSSHNSMIGLLNHFSDLCLDAGWPPYGVMVVATDGNNPTGYYKWCQKRLPEDATALGEPGIIAYHRSLCSESPCPSAHQITIGVAGYLYKHGL